MTDMLDSIFWVDLAFGVLLLGSLVLSEWYPGEGFVLFAIGAGMGFMLHTGEKMVLFDRYSNK